MVNILKGEKQNKNEKLTAVVKTRYQMMPTVLSLCPIKGCPMGSKVFNPVKN
jgi:hypothetical protein